ncbi:MAG: hypothetical protein LWW82_13745 [Comamonadaceae bacterium]|nr:hypothetical protein [Comamonadaceae bacterium]
MSSCTPYFEQQHARLDALLHAHLLDLVGGDFAAAQQRFAAWQAGIAAHIEIENTRLLPHVPAQARWAARVYWLEHERITLLAEEYQARLQAAMQNPPRDEPARREMVLTLLDAAHALRHVLEHHHAREEQALAQELPQALQAEVWGAATST